VTHPADAADRIDRSYLPRGEGEERELVIFVRSMNMRPVAALGSYDSETRGEAAHSSPSHPLNLKHGK